MTTVIPIKGDIVTNEYGWFYDLLGADYASPRQVSGLINQANGDDLQVEINSGGGLVDAGAEIYTMLKSYEAPVTVNITGVAYSAASVIAMSGDVVQVSPVAMMMIHNVSGGAEGDFHDMENAADLLKKSNDALANAYMQKTGKSKDEILALMDSTYWIGPQEAIDQGFADKMMFSDDKAPEAMKMTASFGGHIPSLDTLNKFKKFKEPTDDDKSRLALLDAEIKLLNLKGETL